MKYLIRELFSEKGDISMMRLMAFVCCLTSVAIAITGLLKSTPDYSGISMLCGTFLGIAFLGKAMQKPNEIPVISKDDL